MSVLGELKKLQKEYRVPPAYVHKQETAEELYDLVMCACRNRAANGCSTLLFCWDYVFTEDEEEWNAQHQVCEGVVRRLQEEGLQASTLDEFPKPCLNMYDELEQFEGRHTIGVSWK